MGLTDEDLDSLSSEMLEALNGAEGLMNIDSSDSDSEDDGKTATFPFLNRLMSQMGGQPARDNPNLPSQPGQGPGRRAGRPRAPGRPAEGASASSWTITASTSPSARARASSTP